MRSAGAGQCSDVRAVVLALAAGILAVLALPRLPTLAICTVFAATTLLPWRGRALWAAAVLGMLLCTWHGQRDLAERWPAARHGETVQVQGTVVSLPERGADRLRPQATTWRFDFAPQDAGLPRRIRVSWYRSEAMLAGGDCWRLDLRLRTPRGALNPGGFDYEAWLLREHIGATASVAGAQPCGEAPGHRVLKLRQRIVERIRDAAGENRGAALLAALTVGDTSALRDADWDLFRVTGTTHLIAISGFNLAIVAGFAFLLLRWSASAFPALCLRVPAQRVALYGSALVAVGYAALAGFEAPVTRALIMLLVLVAAAVLDRLHAPSRALAIAAGLILLCDPFAVLSPGFWLSFAAVAAILFVSTGRLRPPPTWRLAIRVQLFLSLALIPLGLFWFHGLAWLSPLVNLLAVPLFSILTPAVLLAVGAALLDVPGHAAALPAAAWALERVCDALAWLARAPAAWLPASPPPAALALATIGAVLAFLPRGVPLRALAPLCLAALLLPRATPTRGGLEVAVLDVGQGTAVLVRTARHALLYDAGPAFADGFDAGRSIVAPYLLGRGIATLDRLVVSHGDNDHAGGVGAVQRLIDVRVQTGPEADRACRDGERWEWDGVRFTVLHPVEAGGADNNASCVLRIDGPFSLLLPGDIERRAERRLLREHRDALTAEVLLAPHHGSASSSSPAFVAAVAPQVVVHSAGWRNRFRHPRPEVVARYADVGAKQWTTGVSGALEIWRSDDGALQVAPWRPQAARWWHAPAEP